MSGKGTAFDSIKELAAKKTNAEQGDYIGEDGLLFCGKCHTRKQGRYEMPWGVVTPPCLCKCEKEKKEMEELNYDKYMLQFRYRKECFGREFAKMSGWTFDIDDGLNEVMSKVSRNYVDNFERMSSDGEGLLLFGQVGTGKSFHAACIANALIDLCIPVVMTNFATIRNALQEDFSGRKNYVERLVSYPLLILDDLSAESKSEYMSEIVFDIIDSRYRTGLPLIVTTNLTSDEMKNTADIKNGRIYSRLFEMCIPLEVKGNDRRRDHLIEAHKKYKAILGY